MNENFAADEKLYRAVYPSGMYWKENGQLSSAAFLSKSIRKFISGGNYLI